MGSQRKKRSRGAIQVPEDIRDQLQPYAEMFETLVIPFVRDFGDQKITRQTALQLHRLTSRFQHERGAVQHPVLVYYGLMLCCYYCGKEDFRKRRPSGETLELMAKAKLFIRLAYQYYMYEDLIFMVG